MKVKLPCKLSLLGAGLLSATAALADQTTPVHGLHNNESQLFALTNVTAAVRPGETIKNATIVINQGKIVSVKKSGKAPAGAKEIDLSGKWVYPGFIDPYSGHGIKQEKPAGFAFGRDPQYHANRDGAKAANDAIHAEKDWYSQYLVDQDVAKQAPKTAKEMINNGFTAVQTAKLDGIFQGQGVTVSLNEGIPNDIIYNAHAAHFGSFDKGSSKQSYPSSLMGSIALIRQTLADASWYKDNAGKSKEINGEPVEYNASLEAMQEMTSSGLIFDAGDDLSILRAAPLFKPYKIRTSYLASGYEYAQINNFKDLGSTLIVPLNFPAAPDVSTPDAQLDVDLAALRHWEYAPTNPRALAENGIEFAFTQHGLKDNKQFWANLRKAVKHGLSKDKALAALTTVPAKLAGVANKAGQIKAGMMADLVVADGDLFDKAEITSVWLQGHERQLKKRDYQDFSGTYQLTLGDNTATIEVTQKEAGKASAKLKMGEDSSDIKKVSIDGHKLHFSIGGEQFGLSGKLLFSVSAGNDELTGIYQDNALTQHKVNLLKVDAEAADKADDADKDADSAIELVGKLTSPNVGFGLEKQPAQENIVFRNATVWTSEKAGVLENTDVMISKGKIKKIGKDLSAGSSYREIDATGMHLSAGLIDEHSHIAISKGVNEGSEAITAEVRIGDVVDPQDIHIYRSLAGGATSAQLLHGSANPIGGQAQVIKLRWGQDAEGMKFKQAPPSIKFALGENVKQANWGDKFTKRYPQTRMGVETIMRDGFNAAKQYRKEWQAYKDMGRSEKKQTAAPRKNFQMETLLEILDGKRLVHTHSYVQSEIMMLMRLVESFDFRIHTFTHILEGYKVADAMAKHGAMASTFADWWAYKYEVIDAIPGNTCLMHDKGVTVSVNSDSRDLQRRLNQEAAKSVYYCDMSQVDAWNMVTINPAKQLGVDDVVGSIKEGKHADLVLWTANPLSVYAKVDQTYIDGRLYYSRAQDKQMREAVQQERAALINKVLADPNAKNGAKNGFKKPTREWHCEDQEDIWHEIHKLRQQFNQEAA